MKAILIDPVRRAMEPVELPDNDAAIGEEMKRIIRCSGLDYSRIDDCHDTILVDGLGLKNGAPIAAFRLSVQRDPFAGKAIILGANDRGATRAPFIPIQVLKADITWLGVIVPDVHWIDEPNGLRAVVTYSRQQRKA